MITLDALKFTFKNFGKLLPYFITPFMLVTIGTAMGLSPAVIKPPTTSILVVAIIGLIVMLAFFWSYIVKGAGIFSLINGLLATNQLLPFDGVDKNITERARGFIKFLLYYALISILIFLVVFIPAVLQVLTASKIMGILSAIVCVPFVIWAFISLAFVYPAFVFNNFEDPKEAIKYSFQIAKGKVWRIIGHFLLLSLILQLIMAIVMFVPELIFKIFMSIKAADFVANILYNFALTIVYFVAYPALITILYREFGGEFNHPDWQLFQNSEQS